MILDRGFSNRLDKKLVRTRRQSSVGQIQGTATQVVLIDG